MLGSCFYFRKMGGSGGKWGIEMANWAEGLRNKFKYVVNFTKIGVLPSFPTQDTENDLVSCKYSCGLSCFSKSSCVRFYVFVIAQVVFCYLQIDIFPEQHLQSEISRNYDTGVYFFSINFFVFILENTIVLLYVIWHSFMVVHISQLCHHTF